MTDTIRVIPLQTDMKKAVLPKIKRRERIITPAMGYVNIGEIKYLLLLGCIIYLKVNSRSFISWEPVRVELSTRFRSFLKASEIKNDADVIKNNKNKNILCDLLILVCRPPLEKTLLFRAGRTSVIKLYKIPPKARMNNDRLVVYENIK